MEWYKPIIFNYMYLADYGNAYIVDVINHRNTSQIIVKYGKNTNLSLTENIVHGFVKASNTYSLTIFSCIITILLTLAGIFYIMLIIDFIMRLMFDINYDNYLYILQ